MNLDRELPKGLIPLDVLHNIEHKHPTEMLIPLLNLMNSAVKLPKSTILGSITEVNNAENVQHMYSLQHLHVKANVETQPSDPPLPAFLDCSSFTTHAHNSNKSPLQLQDGNMPLDIQQKHNNMLNSKFSKIISKSPTDFRRTNLIEMDLPTTRPPVSTKAYTIPLKYKSFIDDEIKLLEDAGCISKLLSYWASLICIIKKKPDPSKQNKPQLCMCID